MKKYYIISTLALLLSSAIAHADYSDGKKYSASDVAREYGYKNSRDFIDSYNNPKKQPSAVDQLFDTKNGGFKDMNDLNSYIRQIK